MPSRTRRPRPAFSSFYAAPLLRIIHPPLRHLSPRPTRWKCAAETPTPSQPTDVSQSNPSRAQVAQTSLEITQNRVKRLHSRMVVRAGEAGIRIGEGFISGEQADGFSEGVLIARLRKELKGLKRLCAEKGVEDKQAIGVVGDLERVIGMVEGAIEKKRSMVGGMAHEEVEEALAGRGEVWEDLDWGGGGGDEAEFVDVVRRRFVDGGENLKRRASSVGAGIGEKVGEFLKDDGSVDVDGLREVLGSVLDNAGMTWKRLNGLSRKEGGEGGLNVRDIEREFELREEIGILEGKLIATSKKREGALRREDQLGKLIRAKEIRLMDDEVSALRRTLAIRVLQLEMDKIFVSVADEIENSDENAMMEQRVLVVEYGDLDDRLATLQVFVEQEEPLLIEDDVLGELAADIQDLKTRLGLDEALYSSATISWPQMTQFWESSARKARAGVEFYSRGLRLFAGDLRFAIRLIRRAVFGYTPSPREIRTLRRTGKDLLTLVPFTIVLIAPLTPVGHVLIFSFLQRFWPEFFPSTFSERRQELMKKHEQYALSLNREDNDEEEGGEREQVGEEKKRKGDGGLSAWRKALFFGIFSSETAEDGEGRKKEWSGSGSEVMTVKGRRVEDSGNAKGNGVDESVLPEGEGDGEKPTIALSDLAESARDMEKMARKKRSTMGLDELHLAD